MAPHHHHRRRYERIWDPSDIEDIQRYRPGGHHPVQIGDILGERYRVVHKLGYGPSSTVWLARDSATEQLVAAKVLAADASPNELTILVHMAGRLGTHPNVSSVQDYFVINGPNGSHRCVVFPPLGPSIKQLRAAELPVELIRDASRQIAEGLDYLDRAAVCHGGELGRGSSQPSRCGNRTVVRLTDAPLPTPCRPELQHGTLRAGQHALLVGLGRVRVSGCSE